MLRYGLSRKNALNNVCFIFIVQLKIFRHMINYIFNGLRKLFGSKPLPARLTAEHQHFLNNSVSFYRQLNETEKAHFESCCIAFVYATNFEGHETEVTDKDKLLVASGSVILAWGFPQWHYVKVKTVILVATVIGHADEGVVTGMVGTHELAGKMLLSKPALHAGFSNDVDKHNVAIHEFAHLIDMADGEVDGLPEHLSKKAFALPWLALIKTKTVEIEQNKSNIRDYAATNAAEFFAVTSEYFFEQPKMLKHKHPAVYKALHHFYKQDRAAVKEDVRISKKAPCPCGSGLRYKHCCLVS